MCTFCLTTLSFTKITAVSTVNKVTCGIREIDGHIECWGLTSRLQTTEDLPHEWEQVTSGFQHTCGINAESEVSCWGPTFASQQNAVDVPDGFIGAQQGCG